MKREDLLFDSEWLMRKIAADPDIDTEAGLPLPRDPGPIMMALVELIRFAPRDEKVSKLTEDAMLERDALVTAAKQQRTTPKASEGKRLSAERLAESFAKYHDEHASYGGVSREFHARASTYIRSQAERLIAVEAELAASAKELAIQRTLHMQWRDKAEKAEAENARLREALTSVSTLVIGDATDASFNRSNLCEAVSTARAALKEPT